MLISAPHRSLVAQSDPGDDAWERDTDRFPDKEAIAALTRDQIARMTCEELVRVIRAARMALVRPEIDECLDCYDRTTLERLAFLARRCCRNQGQQRPAVDPQADGKSKVHVFNKEV